MSAMTLLVFTVGVVPEYQSKSFGLTSWRILLSKIFNHQLQGLRLRQGVWFERKGRIKRRARFGVLSRFLARGMGGYRISWKMAADRLCPLILDRRVCFSGGDAVNKTSFAIVRRHGCCEGYYARPSKKRPGSIEAHVRFHLGQVDLLLTCGIDSKRQVSKILGIDLLLDPFSPGIGLDSDDGGKVPG